MLITLIKMTVIRPAHTESSNIAAIGALSINKIIETKKLTPPSRIAPRIIRKWDTANTDVITTKKSKKI